MIINEKTLKIRFYEELNDYLPCEDRKRDIRISLAGGGNLKSIIEKMGVPADAVDLILVNGKPVPLSYQPETGDRISVYPEFEAFDISGTSEVRHSPLRNAKFVLPRYLAGLAEKMKKLGFDTKTINSNDAEEIIALSRSEKRIIITSENSLADSGKADRVLVIQNHRTENQLKEILARLQLD